MASNGQQTTRSVPTQWAPDSATVRRAAGPEYDRGAVWRFFWGQHYRNIWATPVTAPVLHLATAVPGGMVPLQAGGSYQTRSLRLRAANGQEYVLRSVDKDASAAFTTNWQRKLLGGLMKDQTSVALPYGAYVAAQLAEAAGVYHTNPRLVFLADDPALGEFRAAYANDLYLLEERPDGDQTAVASFGRSPAVQSTGKMLAAVHQRPNAQVDPRAYLRARLLDVWLGDWSRREDQWRWASFTKADQLTYRPIPRDRDQAFFLFNDGFITRIVSWFVPKYQSFNARIRPGAIDGLTATARALDRTLLGTLSAEDFRQVADSMRLRLTDAAISRAFTAGPPETRATIAAHFEPLLRARREQLPEVARNYYLLLAQDAWVVGTDQAEHFVLSEDTQGHLRVKMFAQRPNQADSLVTERVYNRRETSSVSLFGLAGDDIFEFIAPNKSGVAVHVFEGEGRNQLRSPSQINAGEAGITWHSRPGGTAISAKKGIKAKVDSDTSTTSNAKSWLKRFEL
ncbi:hypothetical protein [Hymenobacter glacialis]|uniref:Uncharacterized protein n=1 Tax=Hymenobacter glacialis TaxID=1908236 RepID=A0A1G1T7V6_9BACT|nr:hypothetical protein [Hymenobacter glacialis]OGX86914.1 hypothetical protein BEN48_00705 [Hymenobacter glacialis]